MVTSFVFSSCDFVDRSLCPEYKDDPRSHTNQHERHINNPRLERTESFGALGYGHHFRLYAPEDIDEALVELLGEAYAIGQQE